MEEVEYNYIEMENKDEVYCCDKCGYSTQYAKKLWKHKETDHRGKIEKVEYVKEEKIKTKDRFRFGNTHYNSLGRIRIPVYLKDMEE